MNINSILFSASSVALGFVFKGAANALNAEMNANTADYLNKVLAVSKAAFGNSDNGSDFALLKLTNLYCPTQQAKEAFTRKGITEGFPLADWEGFRDAAAEIEATCQHRQLLPLRLELANLFAHTCFAYPVFELTLFAGKYAIYKVSNWMRG